MLPPDVYANDVLHKVRGIFLRARNIFNQSMRVTWSTLLHGDMTMMRIFLGISSGFCVLELAAPWPTFDRHGYEVLRLVFWKEALYMLLWFVHFIGVFWRLGDIKRTNWGIAVNCLGFILFGSLAVGINLALGVFTLPSSLTTTAAFFSLLAVVRVGNGIETASA